MTAVSTLPRQPGADGAAHGGQPVALLTNFIPPYRVPLFQSLTALLPELRVFVSTRMEPNRHWECDWQGIDVRLQRSLALRRRRRHPAGFTEDCFLHFPIDTYKLLRQSHARVVVSGELGFRSVLAAVYRWSPAGRHSKLVLWATVSERTEAGRGALRSALRKILLRLADGVIVNGASGARYAQRMGADPARTFRVPYTADAGRYLRIPPGRSGPARRRLLYAGQLSERKGIQPFLAALGEWAAAHPAEEVELWLAGDGPLRGWLEAFAAPPNLTLQLLGPVPYDELPAVYARCGVFVFPTLADEWGLVVNEALAAGLPVLGSSYSQAVEELVDDGVNGWVFAPGDRGALQRALDVVLRTPGRRLEEMGAAARRRVEALTPDWAAEQIVRVIQRVSEPDPAGA